MLKSRKTISKKIYNFFLLVTLFVGFVSISEAYNGNLSLSGETVCNAANEGTLVYRDDSSSFQSCLETSPGVFGWFRLVNGNYVPATANPVGISITNDTLCTALSEGVLRYNSTSRGFEGCAQTGLLTYAWIATPVVIEDTTPNAISFTTTNNANISTLTVSNAVTLSGFTTNTAATCNDCEISKNGVWVGSTVNGLVPGDQISIRTTSPTNYSSSKTVSIIIGGGTATSWTVNTRAKDNTPDTFSTPNEIGVPLNTDVNVSFIVTGFDNPITVSCSACTLFINTVNVSSGSASVNVGDTVLFRLRSASVYETTVSTNYSVGTVNGTWSVTTQDITPNAFSFSNANSVEPNTLTTSNTVTVSGFNGTLTATCSACSAIARNGVWGGTSVSGFVSGDTIAIRLTSINNYNTQNGSTVTLGNTTSSQWLVTTRLRDTAPNAFLFNNQSNVQRSTLTTSNTISLSGFEGSVPVSISGNGSPQFSISGGGYSTSGNITSGQSLQVRTTSSSSYGTNFNITITAGDTSSIWSVSTGTVNYGSWGNFGSCSASCGGGTYTRTRTCDFSGGGTASCSDCGGVCSDTQACNTQSCYTYDWLTGGWGSCDSSCGPGTQYRVVYCRRSDGATVADGFCNSGTKPNGSQACDSGSCCHSQTGNVCEISNDSWCASSSPWACADWQASSASCEKFRGGTITYCNDSSQTICCNLIIYGWRQCDGSCTY